jgi:hypothetical protein
LPFFWPARLKFSTFDQLVALVQASLWAFLAGAANEEAIGKQAVQRQSLRPLRKMLGPLRGSGYAAILVLAHVV